MITRLYVDNFRCFVNFEWNVAPIQLVLGSNGTGKSTLLDILCSLREFVADHEPCSKIFPSESRTRWEQRSTQTIELDVRGNGGLYSYRLEIEHDEPHRQNRVGRETLTFDRHPLFEVKLGEGKLYRDDFSEGPEARFDWLHSGVAALAQRPDNQRLIWFREWFSRCLAIRIRPGLMETRTEHEVRSPARDLSNFAAWYRHLLQEDPEFSRHFTESLVDLIPGCVGLKLTQLDKNLRAARLEQRSEGLQEKIEFGLDELSDGQRVLIGLYSILHYRPPEFPMTLFIDEPDNYVALSEIQPWLVGMRERVDEGDCQLLIISHHPEIIDYLARDCGVILARSNNGPVRIRPFDHSSKLSPAEVISRGWEDA